MGEFANRISEEAAETMRHLYQEQPAADANPILELIGFLLEDHVGASPTAFPVTVEQWLIWNQLAMERAEELAEAMTTVLDEERMKLPSTPTEMRNWAASLLLITLDWMGMV